MFKYDTVIYKNEKWTFISREEDKCVIFKKNVYLSITITVNIKDIKSNF